MIVPRRDSEQITFFTTHLPQWAANYALMGTTPEAVAALEALTAAALAAYQAQGIARDQARTATQAFHDALAAMNKAGGDIIKQTKAKAAVDGNSVYNAAVIPAPKAPSPIAAPGTPTNFRTTLNADGALQLKWDCPNPHGAQGTVYQLTRRIGDTGSFESIGITGVKRFTDRTLPAGAARITYQITALRSTRTGPAAQFIVNIGGAAADANFSQVARAA